MFQNFTDPSCVPAANVLPSGVKATAQMVPTSPEISRSLRLEGRSQRQTVSLAVLTTIRRSGESAIRKSNPSSDPACCHVPAFQRLIRLSPPPSVSKRVPSREKRSDGTRELVPTAKDVAFPPCVS